VRTEPAEDNKQKARRAKRSKKAATHKLQVRGLPQAERDDRKAMDKTPKKKRPKGGVHSRREFGP